ncbi:hypothetical protein QTO30_19725 [Yoonia sp. GPGPB17]|uniref:hypothetical protein n=1 Tax=Yoonia sp. GPGPB17 TaxID=3026147 RepID=UPI0030BE60E1
MERHTTHKFWLKVSAIVIGFFGPVLTLGTIPATNELARFGLDILTWPIDGFPNYQSQEIRFLSALTGGFLVGWAVTIWMLSTLVYDHAPETVRKSVVYGACAWFVFDSFGSITSGHWPNALWNILVLLAVVGPMWRPARPSV